MGFLSCLALTQRGHRPPASARRHSQGLRSNRRRRRCLLASSLTVPSTARKWEKPSEANLPGSHSRSTSPCSDSDSVSVSVSVSVSDSDSVSVSDSDSVSDSNLDRPRSAIDRDAGAGQYERRAFEGVLRHCNSGAPNDARLTQSACSNGSVSSNPTASNHDARRRSDRGNIGSVHLVAHEDRGRPLRGELERSFRSEGERARCFSGAGALTLRDEHEGGSTFRCPSCRPRWAR